MRYNLQEFNKAVSYYKRELKKTKVKNIFIYGDVNKKAFFSMAPFSRAADDLGIDVNVSFGHKGKSHELLFDVWDCYEDLKKKKQNTKTKALKEFLDSVEIKGFNKFFDRPDLILKAEKNQFKGTINLNYSTSWFKPFMQSKLKKTTDSIVKNVYALKKSECLGIGFVLIPNKKFLTLPLQDYLDSYAICYSMFLSSKNKCKSISLKSSTVRESLRQMPEKISELMTTLIGMELEKNLNLLVFKKYKKLSDALDLSRIKIPQASFFISAKGYHGKHLFGEKIGYPTKNNKTKWNSPGGIIYKFNWYPQAGLEDRPPLSRVAFTSTVPIDKLIESSLVDYALMRKRNKQIADLLKKSDKVIVKSNIKNGCDFEVGLIKNKKRRSIMGSDSDVRTIVHPRVLKETGKKTGRMANIPGGEAFTTPAYVKGRIVGDVVINIDRSYTLSAKIPLIAEAYGNSYKILSGTKDVVDAFRKKKKEAWKNILEQEKNKSLSPEIIKLKKDNFNNIGEFAINTNPKAKLCDYLIINEKIANMIHVAFGSGFEPDAATEYHMDVVIDAPRQKLDLYGLDKNNKKFTILEKGKFVI
ncbi:hypothetical protein JXC34_04400 [Candidatus Woesearchaeota archaeon]|nr:hypothetical protein [Candidatus Woesearchaeota archaeon]